MKSLYLYIFFTSILFFTENTFADNGDTLHVYHYTIRLNKINTQTNTLQGSATLFAVSKLAVNTFTLDFKALTVDSLFVNDINTAYLQFNDSLRVLLQQPLDENDTFSITVYYHGTPFHESWGGFHWAGTYAFNLGVGFESVPHNLGKSWFPCIDNFTDRASYDVFVTLENGKTAVCGGTLQQVVNNADSTQTWHWQLPQNIPTYLASVAVGDYVLWQDTFYGTEDTIPVLIYVRPGDSGKVSASFANIKTTLHFFEEKFGPYPFDRVGYVGTSIGAMEHATNIAYPHFAIDGTLSFESLYTHELSHMWFGDKITCDKAEEMWINEGWASFCEMYYLEAYGKHKRFIKQMRERNAKVLQHTATIDGGNYSLAGVPQNVTYGSTSYDKGAVVVNTLRGYLGDSLFSVGVKYALQTLGFKSVSSTEWLNAIGEGAGVNLQDFADAWVYTAGTPHFSIDSAVVSPLQNKFKVDIYLHQKYKDADYLANSNILEIGFLKDDFSIITDTVHFSGKYGHSVKYISFNPLAVMMDPYEKTDDATIDYFKIITETGNYSFQKTYLKIFIDAITDSAFVRVTHHWVAPDSIKNQVTGLRISKKRYWQVEGYFPPVTAARGKFYFSNSPSMDADLELTMEDSVMILYRADRSDDWHYVPQYLYGLSTIGYIFIEDLKPGEYAVAAINKQYLGITKKPTVDMIKIFPNPANGKINVNLNDKDNYFIIVTDSGGKTVMQERFYGKNISLTLKNKIPGIYVISVYKNGMFITSQKVIVE